MAITDISTINESDTLAEGRVKMNQAITRINDGEFDELYVEGNATVTGTLTASEIQVNVLTQTSQSEPVFTLSDGITEGDVNDRGILFKYVENAEVKSGFFGWGGLSAANQSNGNQTKFKFIPEVDPGQTSGFVFGGDKGTIDAYIEASDILNPANLKTGLITEFVDLSSTQTITGQKTISNFLSLTNASQGTSANHALPAGRVVNATDGLLINGSGSADLTGTVTLKLDSTAVRTSGNQTIQGTKTFSKIIASDVITGTAQFVTNGVYTVGDQSILGNKVFRNASTQDGVQLLGRNGGVSSYKVSLTPTTLSDNRTITLPNANATITSGTMMNLEGTQTVTGEKTFEQNVLFDISGAKHGIQGSINGNDHWFVGGHAELNQGYAEIATGSGGDEPIYVRQYAGSPLTGTIQRTATLLDDSGDTILPGSLTLGTQASSSDQAVRADRTITAGDGLSGGGDLSSDRSLAVDGTVVRTSGSQTISGEKTFGNTIYASDGIQGNASTATKLANTVDINGIPFDGSQNINVNTAVDGIFYESLNTVTQNYVVPTDTNAMAIGPITIAPGINITVSDGATFRII